MRRRNGMWGHLTSVSAALMNVVDILKDIDITEILSMKSMIMRLLQSIYVLQVEGGNVDKGIR